jgi:predicted MFS family arabinose efflux permease
VARATSAYVGGTVTGGFCGRAVAGVVAAEAGWAAAFLVLAALNLLAAVALGLWLPAEGRAAQARRERTHRESLRGLLANRQLIATDAVGFCVLFTQTAMFTYVTFHLEAPPYGLSTAALGSLFVVYLIGAAVTPITGRWIDLHGQRAGLSWGMLLGVAGAGLTLVPALPVILAGLALVATGVFISQATASSYIGAATASDRGLAVGLYSLCYYAGGSFGAALPGFLWDAGGWPACVALVVIVQVTTIALAMTFWTPRSRGASYDATPV